MTPGLNRGDTGCYSLLLVTVCLTAHLRCQLDGPPEAFEKFTGRVGQYYPRRYRE